MGKEQRSEPPEKSFLLKSLSLGSKKYVDKVSK